MTTVDVFFQQIIKANQPYQKAEAIANIEKEKEEIKVSDLNWIKGLWTSTIEKLKSKGISTREELAKLTEEEVDAIVSSPVVKNQLMNFIKSQQLWMNQ